MITYTYKYYKYGRAHIMPRKKTHEEFIEEVAQASNGKMVVLSEYKGADKPVQVKHLECGREYPVQADSLRRNGACKYCRYKTRKKPKPKITIQQFKSKVMSITDGEYMCISDSYVNAKTHVTMKHIACGNEYPVTPDDFNSGRRCPECAKVIKGMKRRKSHDKFAQEVCDLTNGGYVLMSTYTRECDKVIIKHLKCDKEYPVTPNSFLGGKRCPRCNESRGESLIRKALDYLKVPYKEQMSFDGLILERKLSYDFFLPDNNTLIEYQGKQHYQPIELFGGEESFIKQTKRDAKKKEYAINNNYRLIEIPYTVTNLKSVITLIKNHIQS